MIIGKVIGYIWGTVKASKLEGFKLLEIQPITLLTDNKEKELLEISTKSTDFKASSNLIVAVDKLGAGIGEYVIVGESTRIRDIVLDDTIPIKALVLGIVDKGIVYKKFL